MCPRCVNWSFSYVSIGYNIPCDHKQGVIPFEVNAPAPDDRFPLCVILFVSVAECFCRHWDNPILVIFGVLELRFDVTFPVSTDHLLYSRLAYASPSFSQPGAANLLKGLIDKYASTQIPFATESQPRTWCLSGMDGHLPVPSTASLRAMGCA